MIHAVPVDRTRRRGPEPGPRGAPRPVGVEDPAEVAQIPSNTSVKIASACSSWPTGWPDPLDLLGQMAVAQDRDLFADVLHEGARRLQPPGSMRG